MEDKKEGVIVLLLTILLISNTYLVVSTHKLKRDVNYIKSDVADVFYWSQTIKSNVEDVLNELY